MSKMIVLLSGPVSSGKSTLAKLLAERFNFTIVRTLDLLKQADSAVSLDRESLQLLGERLDQTTDGEWVLAGLARRVTALPENSRVVLDAVRIEAQAEAIRRGYGSSVIHVHIDANDTELARRYKKRRGEIRELESYADVQKNDTEKNVRQLADVADIVLDTVRSTEEDVLVRVASHLGLYGRSYDRLVDVVVGGQFGSEGKGQIAAYLSREYDLLIRVGGPNAGHKVFEETSPFTFHSLPSGSRCSVADILIGPGAVVYVPSLLKEINECQLSKDRLAIDPQVMIISDDDRTKEVEQVKAIASTGQGVGRAMARRILDRGVQSVTMAKDVDDLKHYIRPAARIIETACAAGKKILLEGTQGTGLSLYHGVYPFVTSRDTTVGGCIAEAGIPPGCVRKVVMVCRTYPIRVQNPDGDGKTSGPMSQEISLAEIARRSGLSEPSLRRTETTSTTGRKRRIAEFDWVLLKRAATLNAPSDIALTFVDYLDSGNEKARRFEQLTPDTLRFIEEVERVAKSPVSLISTRFHTRSIIDRRSW